MEIPHVGMMTIRNNVIGVNFHNHLEEDTRTVLTRATMKDRKRLNNFLLTKENLV